MSNKEGDLTKASTMSATTDWLRIVNGGVSENISPTNFATNVLDALLTSLGYIKSLGVAKYEVVTVTTVDLTLVVGTHENVFANTVGGAVGITLPDAGTGWTAATNKGYPFMIKKDDADATYDLTVSPAAGQTIDGAASYVLSGADSPFIKIIPTGLTTWKTIGG